MRELGADIVAPNGQLQLGADRGFSVDFVLKLEAREPKSEK